MMKTGYLKAMLLLASLLLLAAVAGCGKKGPPLPPENLADRVAAPYDLKLSLVGSNLYLSWKHEIDEETAAISPDSFEVFMAKKGFEDCEGCPFKFESAGQVAQPKMEFYLPVTKGYKYYFRMQALRNGKNRSPYSKTVQFEFK